MKLPATADMATNDSVSLGTNTSNAPTNENPATDDRVSNENVAEDMGNSDTNADYVPNPESRRQTIMVKQLGPELVY